MFDYGEMDGWNKYNVNFALLSWNCNCEYTSVSDYVEAHYNGQYYENPDNASFI